MKIRKRMLGLTLCLCVPCGLLPVAAQAAVYPCRSLSWHLGLCLLENSPCNSAGR